MKAVVMAGGSGTRLRPLTMNRPKPMVPVVDKPVIGHILDLLKRHGITEVVITLQYRASDVQDFFGDGSSMGMDIEYSIEESPLGTAGSVKQAQELLDDTFIVISGDSVTDIDLTEVIAFHKERKAAATLTLFHVPNPLEYGVIITDPQGRIQRFQEKPSWGEVISDTVNTGIYVLEPRVLDYFEPGVQYDFSKDLFPLLMQEQEPLYGFVGKGYWCDVGNIAEYMRANGDVLEGLVKTESPGTECQKGVYCAEGVEIAPDAQLYGPIYLGQGVKIKGGVIIHGPTVIRDYSVIDNGAHIERSIIWRNCYVGEGVELRGAIICRHTAIKSKAVIFEGAVVGDSSVIGEGSVIHPGVKIWPQKEIEAGATVRTSIIWGAQGRRVLFGRYGVTGLVNVDLTPEFAARLGAAFAATLPKGSSVIMNRDPHRSPRMLKRGAISGLASAGVNVADVGSVPIPVARYIIGSSDAQGGMHVRLSPFDNRVVDIKFFDAAGQDLSKDAERNIEKIYFREDFRRVYLDEIGTIDYAEHVYDRYMEAFMKVVDVEVIAAVEPRIVVDFANAPAAELLPRLEASLKIQTVALNSSVDETKMSIPTQEFQDSLTQLGRICGALEICFGVRLDVGGERVYVVDERGKMVSGVRLAAAVAQMALRKHGGGTIAVPVSMPNIFEKIAEQNGGRVERTKNTPYALMSAANSPDVILAANGFGAFIWPDFQPVIDGIMTVVKMAEFMTKNACSLSSALAQVPEYCTAQGVVACPWETKGRVMRLLNEQFKDRLMGKQVDGVKVDLGKDEWVLISPDEDQPRFQIYTQAQTDAQAVELIQRYARIVEGFQD